MRVLSFCLVLALSLFASVGAADKGNVEEGRQVPRQQISKAEELQMAYTLARYGQEKQSAEALLLAAQIFGSAGAEELKTEKSTEAGDRSGAAKDAPEITLDAADLLALATEIAPATLEARIAEVQRGLGKGEKRAVGGPRAGYTTVNAYATDVFNDVVFRGGEPWVVTVNGDGDTDLDLFIYDDRGNLIDSDEGGTDYAVCSGVPRYTGPFTIRVKNLGGVYNRYHITVE